MTGRLKPEYYIRKKVFGFLNDLTKFNMAQKRPIQCPDIPSWRTIPTLATSPPLPLFLGRKWKWRRSDSWLFRIRPCAPPTASGLFRNSLWLRRIANPLALQDAHTDAPCKKLLTISFRCDFVRSFFSTRSWHHQQTEQQKTANRSKMSINFYIRKWTVDNARTKTMVKLC